MGVANADDGIRGRRDALRPAPQRVAPAPRGTTVIGATRVLFMFSVATLTLASPVYFLLWESPGLGGLLRLGMLLQVVPTTGLVLADWWLERRQRAVWNVWRGALVVFCLLALARQLQSFFRLPVLSRAEMPLVAGVVVGLSLLAIRHKAVCERFLSAFAPSLVVWTLLIGYWFLPANQHTMRQVTPANPPAVFVLLFDELDREMVMPGGQVAAGLPNFRRLAEGARAFSDATANYSWTCASVGSILGGRLLARPPAIGHGCLQNVPGLREDNLLIDVARRLPIRVYGQYLTYCFDSAFDCRGTANVQAWAPLLPLLQFYVPDGLRFATGADRVLGYSEHTYTLPVFERFLVDIRAADARGTFHWLHVLLPHAPFVFDATGATHRPNYREYWSNPNDYRRGLAAYRRQIGFVDTLLGRFLDRLDAEGLTGDAIVVVTSDHGFLSLHPPAAPQLIGGFDVGAPRARVPLIIRASGVAPGVVADNYQHVDFRRLLLGLIDGAGVPAPIGPEREKVFCDTDVWYVRDADRTWRPQLGPDRRPRACS